MWGELFCCCIKYIYYIYWLWPEAILWMETRFSEYRLWEHHLRSFHGFQATQILQHNYRRGDISVWWYIFMILCLKSKYLFHFSALKSTQCSSEWYELDTTWIFLYYGFNILNIRERIMSLNDKLYWISDLTRAKLSFCNFFNCFV